MLQRMSTGALCKNILYRLADKSVADLWVQVHTLAEERLVDLQLALQKITAQPDDLVANDRESLLKAARKGEIVVLDVRPTDEYLNAHLPFARSIPLEELRQRIPLVDSSSHLLSHQSQQSARALLQGGRHNHHAVRHGGTQHRRSLPSVMDAVNRVPKLQAQAAHIKQTMRDKLNEHTQYIHRYGGHA